jgi:hypothetical protein
MGLNHRVLGRLCFLAEQVEELVGLEVLPDYEAEQVSEADE